MKRLTFTLLLVLFAFLGAVAQPRLTKVQFTLIPDHTDAQYECGEQAKVKLIATDCGMALNDITVKYEVSEDLMPAHISKSVKLKGNEGVINIGTMKKPGFLRISVSTEVDGRVYSAISTVGYSVEQLKPTVTKPEDFDSFWQKNMEALRKSQLAPIMTLLPERCTDKVNVYHISYGNYDNSRMYGILTMPKAEGKYPAILLLPGGGVTAKTGDIVHAERGVIILELGIHGIPVNMTGTIYSDLNKGALILSQYAIYNMDNRDNYYYKRCFIGCVRAIDFIETLPQYNGKIGTFGGSQGGALSIVTSSLDSRISATVAYVPGLCDLEGFLHGRAGGYPFFFINDEHRTPEKINTMRYFDVANFSLNLKVPILYFLGFNDITCSPTSTYSTYNIISAPKELIVGQINGHWIYPEQANILWDWIITKLQK